MNHRIMSPTADLTRRLIERVSTESLLCEQWSNYSNTGLSPRLLNNHQFAKGSPLPEGEGQGEGEPRSMTQRPTIVDAKCTRPDLHPSAHSVSLWQTNLRPQLTTDY